MKESKNKHPSIEEITNPTAPVIKKNFDLIDSITSEYSILKDYNSILKSLLQEHYKAFYNYTRCRIKVGSIIRIEHLILMDGIIARSLNIYEGILREFKEKNMFSFHCLLRAHIETLCLIYYINKNPDYIKNAVNGIKNAIKGIEPKEKFQPTSILTMLKHTNQKYNKLEENYNILSEYVHPNSISLRTNLNIELPKKKITFKSHIDKVPAQQALTNIDLFVKWTKMIFDELKLLNDKILELEKKFKKR